MLFLKVTRYCIKYLLWRLIISLKKGFTARRMHNITYLLESISKFAFEYFTVNPRRHPRVPRAYTCKECQESISKFAFECFTVSCKDVIAPAEFRPRGQNHRPVKNNKAIIWTNIRTTVTLKAREWEKQKKKKKKKKKKTGNEKWSGSLICNLIDEYEARPCLWNMHFFAMTTTIGM